MAQKIVKSNSEFLEDIEEKNQSPAEISLHTMRESEAEELLDNYVEFSNLSNKYDDGYTVRLYRNEKVETSKSVNRAFVRSYENEIPDLDEIKNIYGGGKYTMYFFAIIDGKSKLVKTINTNIAGKSKPIDNNEMLENSGTPQNNNPNGIDFVALLNQMSNSNKENFTMLTQALSTIVPKNNSNDMTSAIMAMMTLQSQQQQEFQRQMQESRNANMQMLMSLAPIVLPLLLDKKDNGVETMVAGMKIAMELRDGVPDTDDKPDWVSMVGKLIGSVGKAWVGTSDKVVDENGDDVEEEETPLISTNAQSIMEKYSKRLREKEINPVPEKEINLEKDVNNG